MSNKPQNKRYRPHDPVEWIQKDPLTLTPKDQFNGYTIADAAAIQALYEGRATPEHQKRAIDWIVNVLCKTHDLHYFDNARDTDFSLGKSFVGKQIVKLAKLDTREMEEVLKHKRQQQQ